MSENKIRKNRTVEERVAEIDKKIQKHEAAVENLRKKKEAILHPKARTAKPSAAMLKKLMEEKNLSYEDVVNMIFQKTGDHNSEE